MGRPPCGLSGQGSENVMVALDMRVDVQGAHFYVKHVN